MGALDTAAIAIGALLAGGEATVVPVDTIMPVDATPTSRAASFLRSSIYVQKNATNMRKVAKASAETNHRVKECISKKPHFVCDT